MVFCMQEVNVISWNITLFCYVGERITEQSDYLLKAIPLSFRTTQKQSRSSVVSCSGGGSGPAVWCQKLT